MLRYECINITSEYLKPRLILLESELRLIQAIIKCKTDCDEESKSIISEISTKMELNEDVVIKFIKYLKDDKTPNFKDYERVLKEQISFFKHGEMLVGRFKCTNLYYVSMYSDDRLVISMFVANYPHIKSQVHYYIVKDLYYFLWEFLQKIGLQEKQPKIKNSSIRLHSFASDLFGNKEWCTSPLASMGKILKAKGFKSKKAGKPIVIELLMKTKCKIRESVSVCYNINQFKNIWKKYGVNVYQKIQVDKGTIIGTLVEK